MFSTRKKKIQNLIYISSDAVYSDTKKNKREICNKTKFNSWEDAFTKRNNVKKYFKSHFCIIRPTLVYGPGDTHKGYGPNKFINLALKKRNFIVRKWRRKKRSYLYR